MKKKIKRVAFNYCQNCVLKETKYCQHFSNEKGNKIGTANKKGKFWCSDIKLEKHYMFIEVK